MTQGTAAQDAVAHAKGRTRERYQRSRAPGTKTLIFAKDRVCAWVVPVKSFSTQCGDIPVQTLETGLAAPLHIPVAATLTPKAEVLYKALRSVGRTVSDARGYCAAVSVVFFFVPGEVVADALLMARSTMYLKLAELKAVGLVEARAHYCTHKGRTRSDGMVWAVKMQPRQEGKPVRVPYDALKKSYRCLSADIANGRTAFRETGQSKKTTIKQVDIQRILAWALPPSTTQKPVKGMTVRPDLEQVLDVPHVDKVDRNTVVDGAARALAVGLSDAGGLMFYRWLLWQLLRLADRGGGDYWHMVYEQARRAAVDSAEGFARRPGALFVSRLKAAPWWDEVMRQPPTRVGLAPLQS
jgi:hypothetical protein